MREFAECTAMLSCAFMCIALPFVMIWAYRWSDKQEKARHAHYTKEMKKAVSQAVYDIYLDMIENEDI